MTYRFAYPGTHVPGATKIYKSLGVQATGKKGRPAWEMPKGYKMVEHKNGKFVNIYRGVNARLANWYRGQAKRQRLKFIREQIIENKKRAEKALAEKEEAAAKEIKA